jgi:hypothetical protein
MPIERLLGFREAAAAVPMSESTLRKKAALGLVPHRKVFRRTMFSEADLTAIQVMRPARLSGTGLRRRRP